MSMLTKLLNLNEEESKEIEIKINPESKIEPPIVKENVTKEPYFLQRHGTGPISCVDPTWKKNLAFLEKEIKTAERNVDASLARLNKARDELSAADVKHQDCQKKLVALKQAHDKLEALVPQEEKYQEPKEPQLLLEKKTPAKKAAKKTPKKR